MGSPLVPQPGSLVPRPSPISLPLPSCTCEMQAATAVTQPCLLAPPAQPQSILSSDSSIREHHWTLAMTWLGKPTLRLQAFSSGRGQSPYMESNQPAQENRNIAQFPFLAGCRMWKEPCLNHYQPNRARRRQVWAGEPRLLTLS